MSMVDNDVMDFIDEVNLDDVTLTPADESAILLTALEDASTPEEFETIMENATELELYNLIDNAETVMEAKRIVYKQTKSMNLSREQSKAALRLAKRANSAEWKKYRKNRDKMIEARNAIFRRFGPKAKTEARNIIQNARKKSSSMSNTVTGKTISKNLDKKVNEINKK